jgi:hypothetical protein
VRRPWAAAADSRCPLRCCARRPSRWARAARRGSSWPRKVSTRERKDGPNFDQRKEQESDVLYAIENGGFSSGPMPQDILTGEDAKKVAAFIAKYSGQKAARPPSPAQVTPAPAGQ